ncbi:MAG TPA: nucleotidyltransferase family protein [Rhodothermales bacterium]|nr:nucleotidyltransferase family protein [Rhodothermales bacterium]
MGEGDQSTRHGFGGENRGWRPTSKQELLLRAALLKGVEAREAWEGWKEDVDIDRLGMPSVGILPLLYANLLSAGVVDPLMDGLKKRYTITWYNNQILLNRISRLLAHLGGAGIQTILLKGAAMTIAYYEDHGVRPMGDVDVLIQHEDVLRASTVLAASGFDPSTPMSARAMRYMHGAHFVDERGFSVDLHWRLLWEADAPEVEADLWNSARDTATGDASTRVLDPTYQLFHVLVHGARWNSAPLRWVADAVTITNTRSDEVDFERIATIARALGLHLPVVQALRYLGDTWSVQVPETVLASLEAIPTSRIERAKHRYLARNRKHLLLGNLPTHIFHFRRFTSGMGPLRRLAELPRFLAFAWGLGRVRDLPVSILAKVGRRAGVALRSLFGDR